MFVERAAERERIDTLLALTRAGSGRALVVRGQTIEKHLGSSDSKLALRSRAELARVFAPKEPAAADVAARA